MITSAILKDEIYRIEYTVPEGIHHAIYHFHKMGRPGHRITANRSTCNCADFDRKRVFIEYYACKHIEAARRMDFERLQEVNNHNMRFTIGEPGGVFDDAT